MKRYYLGEAFPGIYLSGRQAQCMAYFILGYSNARVAKLLNLSWRTIDAYVIDMRQKLHFFSKKTMIEKVKQTSFMQYIDELTKPTLKTVLDFVVKSEADKSVQYPRLLLVEPNERIQVLYKTLLESLHCEVDAVETGEAALESIKPGYDLLFINIALPGINGIEVSKKIRLAKKSYRDITIIMIMMSWLDKEFWRLALESGVNDCLFKPVTREDFEPVLKRWVPHYQSAVTMME